MIEEQRTGNELMLSSIRTAEEKSQFIREIQDVFQRAFEALYPDTKIWESHTSYYDTFISI